MRQYRVNGQIEAKRRGGYQKPTISHEHLSIIQSLVKGKNDLLLRELCVGVARRRHRFAEITQIRTSIFTTNCHLIGWCKSKIFASLLPRFITNRALLV